LRKHLLRDQLVSKNIIGIPTSTKTEIVTNGTDVLVSGDSTRWSNYAAGDTLLDIFHATPQSSQRLIPIARDNQCVASVAALRETKMSISVGQLALVYV
jgi:hypothetical protein